MDVEHSARPMPILIADNYEHIMAHADIVEEPNKTSITITVEGEHARYFAACVTSTEPVALSFAGIPVQPRKKNIKE